MLCKARRLSKRRPANSSCLSPPSLSWVVVAFVAGAVLAGCQSETVILWTDSAEVAPIVELFNAEQDDYIVELTFESDVSRALRLAESYPDVVIAADIEDVATARLFRPLDGLLGRSIDPSEFYSGLLSTGSRSGKQRLLPVSFNLPLIYFAREEISSPDSITISPEEMREAATGFNEIDDDRASHLGYSPLWNGAFLYELLRYEGWSVQETPTGEPRWSLDELLRGINFARDWIANDNGGVNVDVAFKEQYLYDPVIRLVQQGRVLFGYDTSGSFFTKSDAARADLRYRWIGKEDDVHVLESSTYAGMPEGAGNRAGGDALLAWLFDVDVQRQLLEHNLQRRTDAFGVVGGFSSMWRVTERAFPEWYPELATMTPPASWLHFAPPSPRHWSSVRTAVVEPWLLREVAGRPQSRDLSSSVTAWLMQQED